MPARTATLISSAIADFKSRPSYRGEWIWMWGRVAALCGILTLVIAGQEQASQAASLFSLLFAAAYMVATFLLLRARRLVTAFTVGTVGDMSGLMGGWLASVIAQRNDPQESDAYLIMFMVLLALPYRYGAYIGSALGLLLIGWISAVSYVVLPHDTYTIEQFPTRIIYFISTLGLAVALSKNHAARAKALEASHRVAEKLTAVNEAKDAVLSTVTHELKTPLTVIRALTDVLRRNKDENLNAKQHEHLDIVDRNARQLGVLIDDLVAAVQLQRGTLSYKPANIELQQLVAWCVDDTDTIARRREIEVEFRSDGKPIELYGDETRLTQVISNLLSNACRYSTGSSKVVVELRHDDEKAELTVSNSAPGLDQESVSRLFNAFVRLDNERTRSEPGTGLGLFISKSIVEHHNGSIHAELDDDIFRVRVTLPLPGIEDIDKAPPGEAAA